MVHPFDVDFGDDGLLYVSSQDTNTVLAIQPKTRKPAPVASHLRKTFPRATSSPERSSPPAKGGFLKPGINLRWMSRHRRVSRWCSTCTASPGTPCVASSCVASISTWRANGECGQDHELKTGRLVARIRGKKLANPCISSCTTRRSNRCCRNGSILAYDIPKAAPRGKLKARVVIDAKLRPPSGFAMGPDGDLYVAERFDQRIRRFSIKGKKKGTFIDGLPDMPEFPVHIPDPA